MNQEFYGLKVALVHYWFITWRGGEKVVESILKLFPQADIYTLFYDKKACGAKLGSHQVFSSILNKSILRSHHQKVFPLYPAGIKSLKLRQNYDLVISSESGPAKGVNIQQGTPHLCYTHTPMRYCWGFMEPYLESLPPFLRVIAQRQLVKLRDWDKTTIDKVDLYVANSQNVADRIQKFYGRSSEVCYPPIALDLFKTELKPTQREYYLSFGAITPYKNIRLLVETFNKTGQKLVVIGEGSEKSKLAAQAQGNIKFTGSLPWESVLEYINKAKALIFPGEEDFGMIPLEVMSQGLPVIALKRGGTLETVIENRNNLEKSSGLFFEKPTQEDLIDTIDYFEQNRHGFNSLWIRNHARIFGEDFFLERMTALIKDLLNSRTDRKC